MAEHSELLDSELVHEPKGIKESSVGELYFSRVVSPTEGPFTGEWRKLKVDDMDITIQGVKTQSFTSNNQVTPIVCGISGNPTGTVDAALNFQEVNQALLELARSLNTTQQRLNTVIQNQTKAINNVTSLVNGLKRLGLFKEEF